MIERLIHLDRRWIFLAMFLAVAVPVLLKPQLPESPTPMVRSVFDTIEELPPGSRIFFSLDYDPASQPELGPMTRALTRHSALRGHSMIFMTLWPFGGPMITLDAIDILETEFGDQYTYGDNYLNLGYGAGMEAAIKLIVTNLARQFPVDAEFGRPLGTYPITRGVRNLEDVDLVVSIGAGFPGTKEWVQYAATPFPTIRMVAGVTGVSAPPQYPYIPDQLIGMLPAIKGAAEYEAALGERYGTAGEHLSTLVRDRIRDLTAERDATRAETISTVAEQAGISTARLAMVMRGSLNCMPRRDMEALAAAVGVPSASLYEAAGLDGCGYETIADYQAFLPNYRHADYQPALVRMGPQLSAHVLMLVLIVLGNIIFFIERRRGRRARGGQ